MGYACVCINIYTYIGRPEAHAGQRGVTRPKQNAARSAAVGTREKKMQKKKKRKKEKKTQPGLHNNRPKVNERQTDTTLTRVHLSPFDT